MACGIKVSGISRVKSSNPTKEMGCLLYGFSGWPVDLPVSSHAGKSTKDAVRVAPAESWQSSRFQEPPIFKKSLRRVSWTDVSESNQSVGTFKLM